MQNKEIPFLQREKFFNENKLKKKKKKQIPPIKFQGFAQLTNQKAEYFIVAFSQNGRQITLNMQKYNFSLPDWSILVP